VAPRIFVRRRDGRIEVRLNQPGRDLVKYVASETLVAETDPDHQWWASLTSPITPVDDTDDPLVVLARQSEVTSHAELVLSSLDEEFLNDDEAWAWLCTLQVGLRALHLGAGVRKETEIESLEPVIRETLQGIQALLWSLADVL
jgi:hypothetical protein